jgi:hypothetical protein
MACNVTAKYQRKQYQIPLPTLLAWLLLNTIQGTGTANAYASGVTNNGAVSGRITLLFLWMHQAHFITTVSFMVL